jgi:hypothetical protein
MVRTRSQLAQTPDAPCGTAKGRLTPLEPSFNNQKNNLRPSNSLTPSAEQSFRQRSTTSFKYLPEQSQESNGKLKEEQEEFEDDEEEMYKWGYILLVGSTIAFSVGIWSIAIGPHVDTRGLGVSSAEYRLFPLESRV